MNFKKFLSLTTAAFMAVSALSVNASAAVTNTMTVTNTVEGGAADTQKDYTFTITLTEKNGNVTVHGRDTLEGPAHDITLTTTTPCVVYLKHGESFSISESYSLSTEEHIFSIVKIEESGYDDYTTVKVDKALSGTTENTTIEGSTFNEALFGGTVTFTNTVNTPDTPAATPGVMEVTDNPIYPLNFTIISNKTDSAAVVPSTAIDFTIQPASESQLTGDIKAGLCDVESLSYTAQDRLLITSNNGSISFNSDGNDVFTNGKFTVSIPVDFSTQPFTSAGVYRYVITTTKVENAFGFDTINSTNTMYLDVYVENTETEGTYKVAYFVSSIPGADGSLTKTEGFNYQYNTFDFTLTNNTTGSAGDKEKNFTYTVVFDSTNHIEGANIKVTKNGTDEDITTNSNKTTYTVLLKNGETVNFQNVPKDAKYTITRAAAEGYTTTITAIGDDVNGVINNDTFIFDETTDGITGNTQVTYTNNKEGVLPTGVILATIIPTIVGVTAIGGIGAFIVVKKRDNDSEEEE